MCLARLAVVTLALALAGAAALPAAARAVPAPGGAPYVSGESGGVTYGALTRTIDQRPRVALLAVAPQTVREGRLPRVRFRIVQRGVRAVRVRLAVVPLGRREAAIDVRVGKRTTESVHTVRWPPKAALGPGRYSVRLHALDPAGRTLARRAHQSGKSVLTVLRAPAPQPPAPSQPVSPDGVFPVAGPHGYGGEDARFGAGREGHVHEGQDLPAAEGTPVVAPTAGTVIAVDHQRGGAGYYVTLRSVDGRDFFFAHLQKGSTAVAPGQAVAAGALLGRVGSTGSSTGPHLHFEIWEGGWATGRPVDPLAQLRAWDR